MKLTAAFVLLGLFIAFGDTSLAAATFQGLGALTVVPSHAFASRAYGISGDGSTIVGQSQSPLGVQAFRWTQSTGMIGIGDLPGGVYASRANAVNADGTVVVGTGSSDGQNGLNRAFRWTTQDGMQPLGTLPTSPTNYFFSAALDVSADGTRVGVYSNYISARWTAGQGYEVVNPNESRPLVMSADGNAIAGDMVGGSNFVPYRWTPSGIETLPLLPGNIINSGATAISPDGNVIAGRSGSNSFRWTEDSGIESVSTVAGFTNFPTFEAMSWDGSLMVGAVSTNVPIESQYGTLAVIWTAGEGTRTLEDVLTNDYHVDLMGWRLIDATDVSYNGRVVVGFGLNPSGKIEAFRATIPELNSFWLIGVIAIASIRVVILKLTT
jgi:probable HAF family extracellular repeat protein